MSNMNFTRIVKLDEVDLRNIKVAIFHIRFLLYEEKKIVFSNFTVMYNRFFTYNQFFYFNFSNLLNFYFLTN